MLEIDPTYKTTFNENPLILFDGVDKFGFSTLYAGCFVINEKIPAFELP